MNVRKFNEFLNNLGVPLKRVALYVPIFLLVPHEKDFQAIATAKLEIRGRVYSISKKWLVGRENSKCFTSNLMHKAV
ncbi:hypothetical protein ACVWYG_000120 [Pedobacter sp. UYEF25]